MFSIIMPMDTDRLEQFANTKRVYDEMPHSKEFIIPTRSYKAVLSYLKKHKLQKGVRLISYEVEQGFNCSKALNIGVNAAKYPNIIITSPEVKPTTKVLEQLKERLGSNVVCQVFDQDDKGNLTSLVHQTYRSETPAMYFLAMFNKKDIEVINGWDEEFMRGYAYEDNDFGARWTRAGLPFEIVEDIQAVHQYHPRSETITGGLTVNQELFNKNTADGVTRCKNGLVKE